MKSTGIVRHVDNLDRIVIPKELCRTLGIEPKTSLEIFIENLRIVLKKHEPTDSLSKSKVGLGIVRQVDSLDRIVIPKEICKTMGIEPKDSLEIFVDGQKIVLGKYGPSCIFCQEVNDVIMYKKKLVCEKCIKELTSML